MKWKNFFHDMKEAMEEWDNRSLTDNATQTNVPVEFGNLLSEAQYNVLLETLTNLFKHTSSYSFDVFEDLREDTLIAVKQRYDSEWVLRRFAFVKNDKIYCYPDGKSKKDVKDPMSTYEIVDWDMARLLDEDFLGSTTVTFD